MIVADVNLVAHLLLGGPATATAQRVLERDAEWAAPLLWRSEFRSVLAAHMRQRGLHLDHAWRAHMLANELLAGREYAVHGEQVLALVAATNCSACDCEYAALAIELGVPLVTADKQLLRSFADQAISPRQFVRDTA